VRGWERGEEERLPPGYRVDTTDAAIEALKPAPIVDGRSQWRNRLPHKGGEPVFVWFAK
jgi:hypothetical protein